MAINPHAGKNVTGGTSTGGKSPATTLVTGASAPNAPVVDDVPVKSFSSESPNGAVSHNSATNALNQVQRPKDGAKRLSEMVTDIYNKDGPLMREARQRGVEDASARGLRNSSIATGTAETVALGQATDLAKTAFAADNAQYQHDQTTAINSAHTDAQIDYINAQIDEMVMRNPDGTPSNISLEQKKDLDTQRDRAFSSFYASKDKLFTTYANDGASLARAIRQELKILKYRLDMMYEGTGVDVDAILNNPLFTEGLWAPPQGKNWQTSSPRDIIRGWRRENMSQRDAMEAINWAYNQGYINLVRQQELIEQLKRDYGEGYNPERPGETPTVD